MINRMLTSLLLLASFSCHGTILKEHFRIELYPAQITDVDAFGLIFIPDVFVGHFTVSYEEGIRQSEKLTMFKLRIGDTKWNLDDLNQQSLDYHPNIADSLPYLSIVDNLGTSPINRNLSILDIPSRHEWSAFDARTGLGLSGSSLVTAVPEPPSFILLSAALVGLGFTRKKRRARLFH